MVGLDDSIVEGVAPGATGWISGHANALPRESVAVLETAVRGDAAKTAALYRWFLPLLRLDTVPKFVQYIKWVQAEVGRGSAQVRPPRLPLAPEELELVRALLARALADRPV
jgi:1-pyrroline-4-hydroxy-2-carboxylate deaminase